MNNDLLFLLCGNIVYALLAILGINDIRKGLRPPSSMTLFTTLGGFLLQTFGLVLRGRETGGCPIGNPFEIIQFITWGLILTYIAVGSAFRNSLLGILSASMVTILGLGSFLKSSWDYPYHNSLFGENALIELHASLALLSYAVFGLLSLTCLMYLIQNHYLHKKFFNYQSELFPSLLELEKCNIRILKIGTLILVFSLIIGTFYWLPNPNSIEIEKLVVTILLSISYISVLFLGEKKVLYHRKISWVCILLFFGALISVATIN